MTTTFNLTTPPSLEFCFLWIDWWPICMTKGEWSGWMQAVGSLVALAIAIGVPLFLRFFDQRGKIETAHATAHVVCAGISLAIGPMIEAIEVARNRIHELDVINKTFDIEALWISFDVTVPTEWQMLQLTPLRPDIATELAVGTHLFVQVRNAIGLVARKNGLDVNAGNDEVAELDGNLLHAYLHLTSAKEDMDAFFGHSHSQSRQ